MCRQCLCVVRVQCVVGECFVSVSVLSGVFSVLSVLVARPCWWEEECVFGMCRQRQVQSSTPFCGYPVKIACIILLYFILIYHT